MRKQIFIFLFSITVSILYTVNSHAANNFFIRNKDQKNEQLYQEMKLDFINYQSFEQAINGYNQIPGKKKDILTFIDFSKPSTEERLYVLDLKNKKLLFKSHVSHGKNSGGNIATSFSNKNGSNKSSLGFFLTAETYQGKNGYSLKLEGLEKGINDKARERAIVIHGADYANPSITQSKGRLGRSLGCPALPRSIHKQIINVIKNGSVLFIYANDANYAKNSHFIQSSETESPMEDFLL